MKSVYSLDGKWELSGRPCWGEDKGPGALRLKGSVPGCAHLDLLDAKLIDDPFWREQSKRCLWIEDYEWSYARDFDLPEGFKTDWCEIEFGGLDTYAEIELNGVILGKTANMFIPHKFDVGSLLKPKGNRISVVFSPYKKMIEGKSLKYDAAFFTSDRVHVRRMQCTFYWDWVDRFVSAGIWRSVSISSYEQARIEDLFVWTKSISATTAELSVALKTESKGKAKAKASVAIVAPDGRQVWTGTGTPGQDGALHFDVEIEKPDLWWPNGYGSQSLYTCRAELVSSSGKLLDRSARKLGIRTVALEELDDRKGSPEAARTASLRKVPWIDLEERNGSTPGRSFTLLVNGKRIFCKGGNWVPPDPFPSRVKQETYERLVWLAKEGNMNILRCWGGGVYESELFYDACDRMGILLVQEFMMACATYPSDDKSFMESIAKEARTIVPLLRSHPCIAWWSGDNENGMHLDFDSKDAPCYEIARKATAPACRELDPSRPFRITSPYGGRKNTSLTIGDAHFTQFYDKGSKFILDADMRDYKGRFDVVGRFLSETANFGLPPKRSLLKFMDESDFADPARAVFEHHTKDNPHKPAEFHYTILGTWERIAKKILGEEQSGSEMWLRKLEYIQHEVARLSIEGARRSKWYCSGIVFWMFNDCWPALSWSMVDYYLFPKASWYAMKRAAQPVICSLQEDGERFKLWVCNDSFDGVEAKVSVFVQPWRGAASWRKTIEASIPANSSEIVAELEKDELAGFGIDSLLGAEVSCDKGFDRACFFPGMPHEMKLPKTELELSFKLDSASEGVVTLSASSFARVVSLDADGDFSDNYFDLLPGERKAVKCKLADGADLSKIPVSCWNAGSVKRLPSA